MAHEIKYPPAERQEEFSCSWGTDHAEQLDTMADEHDICFAPLGKTERLCRIADWTGGAADGHHGNGYTARRHAAGKTAAGRADEDDARWSFVADSSSRTLGRRSTRGGAPATGAPARSFEPNGRPRGSRYPNAGRRGGWGPRFSDRQFQRKRDSSVSVLPEWKIVEEIEFSRLAKLQLDHEDPVELAMIGSTRRYDRACDKISTKSERPLVAEPGALRRSAPVEGDELLLAFAERHAAAAVTSNVVAALLMTCQRTVVPWDITIKRRGPLTILDKRPESDIDLVLVNETAAEPSPEERAEKMNAAPLLAAEATRLQQSLPAALARSGESVAFGRDGRAPVPADDAALRYTRLDLGGEGSTVVVRGEVCAVDAAGEPMHVAALLEYEHKGAAGMDWRLKLDSQRGAVFAHEIRNNSALLSRTVFQTLLSGIDAIKVAYVSRVAPRDASRHAVLGLQDFEPYELATQMNLNIANGFGILRAVVDLCRKLPTDCDYVLMRDPNKPLLRLYRLPTSDAAEDPIDELVSMAAKVYVSEGSGSASEQE